MFKRIIKNITYVSTARIVATLVSFAANIFLVRYLGSMKYGIYITVITYVAFFAILTDMGLPTLLLRSGGEDRKSLASRFTETLVLKIFLSVFAFLLMYLIAGMLNYSIEIKQFSIIAFLTTMLVSFSATVRKYFYIFEELSKEAAFVIAKAVLRSCFILILIYLKAPLYYFFFAFLLESTLIASIAFITVFKKYRIRLNFNTRAKDCLFFLWQALPFAAISLLGILHRKIDIIILSKMRNATEVGLYGAAFKFVDVTLFLPAILSSVLLPILSGNYALGEKNEFRETTNKMLNLCITMIIPTVILIIFFSPKFIPFLYKSEFASSSVFLSILSFTFIFMFPNAIMGTVLYALKKQNIILYNTLACFVFNAFINSILIPRYGAYAAAIIAVLTQILLFSLNFIFVSKHLYKIPYVFLFKIPLISALLMSIFLYFTQQYVWISISGALFLYFTLSFLLGSLKVEDIRKFIKLFS